MNLEVCLQQAETQKSRSSGEMWAGSPLGPMEITRIEGIASRYSKSLGQMSVYPETPRGLKLSLAPSPTVGGRYQINVCLL